MLLDWSICAEKWKFCDKNFEMFCAAHEQRENMRLKQHVLDLRRAARGCGCELNGTEAAATAAYPELGRLLGAAEEAPVLAQGGPAAAAAPAPAPQPGGQTHRPERHRCAHQTP